MWGRGVWVCIVAGGGGGGGTACTGLYAVRRHPPGSDALQRATSNIAGKAEGDELRLTQIRLPPPPPPAAQAPAPRSHPLTTAIRLYVRLAGK
ncbi:unnamed protein product [Danaus chrysippus]|uniref:(African queen) hypothetical protein n=1 Tax=Danaus chrysippus TaxID=151541 RepID=A0A8J2R8L5_9NEOP|nr:unnamed protein product [Danaus chrysippus]